MTRKLSQLTSALAMVSRVNILINVISHPSWRNAKEDEETLLVLNTHQQVPVSDRREGCRNTGLLLIDRKSGWLGTRKGSPTVTNRLFADYARPPQVLLRT